MFPLEKVQGILAQRKRKSKLRPVEIPAKQMRKNRTAGDLSYAAEAAAVWSFAEGSVSPSQRTLTSLETPGSCMVTP
jgi:hypothetical protein